MKEHDCGFFTGSLVAISISGAIMFAFYNWAYSRGQESEKCRMKHNYSFERVKPAFLAVKR